ncbi:MAG: 3-phosphoglycerate dehydrogenase family protein [Acidobacteria bacterium]|nr:3-phosphoglycerate dehydrogenase family protein [Acidobacteriota bacterium]MCA1641159.1 3-phosphoglycerate dehydrogenase family protein [Acidobacteriota bacterium]
MKVLVADKFEQSGQEGLRATGCEVSYQPDLKDGALVEAIGREQPDVLVVRSTKVPEAALDAGALKLVVRAGAGYNTIDVAAASARGIYVSNCPGKNSVAVAELALALILALDRRIADNVSQLREGRWNKKEFSRARGLMGRTLGLVGTGQIGREVISRARAFGMRVVAWSRSLTDERAAELGVERVESPVDVARASDVVSVHVALNPETRGMIGAEFFGAMREGAYFVNTARGEVVDQAALIEAMREKGIRAGLDVYADEPTSATGEFTDGIAKEPNLYGTHHIGASTDQAQEAIAAETVRIVKTFMETGRVPNVVNLALRTPATHTLVVRHRDRPGVLAGVLDAIRVAGINVQEMENVVFAGAQAAVARINLEAAPPAEMLTKLRGGEDIIELDLLELRS